MGGIPPLPPPLPPPVAPPPIVGGAPPAPPLPGHLPAAPLAMPITILLNNDEKQAVLTLVARAIAQLLTLAGAVNVGPHIAVSRHNNRLHVALNWSGTSVVDVTETTLRTAANTALADIKRIAQAYSLNDAVKRALTWLAGT